MSAEREALNQQLTILKEYIQQEKALGAVVDYLEDAYDSLNEKQITVSESLIDHTNRLRESVRVQGLDVVIMQERLELLQKVTDKMVSSARSLDEMISGYVRLSNTLSRQIAALGGFNRSMDQAQREVLDLRNSLQLTRQATSQFMDTFVRSQDLGITVETLKEMAVRLREVRGAEEGMARLRDLMDLQVGPETFARIGRMGPERAAALRVATRAQREAIRDLGPRAPGAAYAGQENFRQAMQRVGDDVKQGIFRMATDLGGFIAPVTSVLTNTFAQVVIIVAELHSANILLAELVAAQRIGGAGGMASRTSLVGMTSKFRDNFFKSGGPKAVGAAIIGTIIAGVGNAIVDRTEKSSRLHTLGLGMATLGTVGTSTAVGAAAGSVLGPYGTAAGGIAGFAYGVYTEWSRLGELISRIGKTEEQRLRMEEEFNASLDAVTQETDNMAEMLRKSGVTAAKGMMQERGRLAQSLLDVFARAGQAGDFRTALAGQEAERAAGQREREGIGRRIATTRAAAIRRQAAGGYEPGEFREVMENLDIQQTQLNQATSKALEAFDLGPYISHFRQVQETQLAPIRSMKEAADERLRVLGSVNGTLSNISQSLAVSNQLVGMELQTLNERQRNLDQATRAQIQSVQAEFSQAGLTDDGRKAIQARLDAIRAQHRIETQTIATERQRAQLAQAEVGIAHIQAMARAYETTPQYRTARATAQTAQAVTELGQLMGGAPADVGATAQTFAAATTAAFQYMFDTLDRDIAAIQTTARATAQAYREQGNEEGALIVETEAAVQVEERRRATIGLQTEAIKAQITAASAEINMRRARVTTETEILEIQKGLAQDLGGSYSQIFDIQGRILERQIQAAELTRQEMERVRDVLGEGAENSAEYQRLQTQYAREAAEVTRTSLGRQRDFLDRALGKAFGRPEGTAFQPIFTQRQLFGEYVQGTNQMALPGRPMTIGEREAILGQVGARRPLAPIGGINQGLFDQGLNPALNPAAPVNPAAPGLKPMMDISGNIQIELDIKTDLLEAILTNKVIQLRRRGNN